jgi:hypothetical protein
MRRDQELARAGSMGKGLGAAQELHEKLCCLALQVRAAQRDVAQRALREVREAEEAFLFGMDYSAHERALQGLVEDSHKVLNQLTHLATHDTTASTHTSRIATHDVVSRTYSSSVFLSLWSPS